MFALDIGSSRALGRVLRRQRDLTGLCKFSNEFLEYDAFRKASMCEQKDCTKCPRMLCVNVLAIMTHEPDK